MTCFKNVKEEQKRVFVSEMTESWSVSLIKMHGLLRNLDNVGPKDRSDSFSFQRQFHYKFPNKAAMTLATWRLRKARARESRDWLTHAPRANVVSSGVRCSSKVTVYVC